MGRLGRWTLNALTVLSLVICVGTVGLWVRSYWCADTWIWTQARFATDASGRLINLRRGGIVFGGYNDVPYVRVGATWTYHDVAAPTAPVPPWQYSHRQNPPDDWWRRGVLGFDLDVSNGFWGSSVEQKHHRHGTSLLVPFWFLTVLALTIPAWHVARFFRDRDKREPGLCPRCGYDLRATPDRCPECGTATTEGAG